MLSDMNALLVGSWKKAKIIHHSDVRGTYSNAITFFFQVHANTAVYRLQATKNVLVKWPRRCALKWDIG